MLTRKKTHKLLVLGGRPIGTAEIVEYAKRKGAYVIVCDYLPVEKSPSKRLADECWDLSTADVDSIYKRARQCNVTAVFTGAHEFNIEKTIEICDKLQLPFYCTIQQWEICQNKLQFKKLCSAFHVPMPETYYFEGDIEKLKQSDIKLPVIVKPTDSSASRGISVCHTMDDLALGIKLAIKHSTEKKIVIERFLTGDEIMIYYTIQNGISYLTGICKRFTNRSYGKDVPLPEFYYFDQDYLSIYEKHVDNHVQKMFDSIGLKNGVVLLQAIFSDNVFYIFEMSLRMNASQEHNLTSAISGFNSLEMLVDYSLTGKFGTCNIEDYVDPHWGGKYVCILPIVLNVGKVKTIKGIDLIKRQKNVVSVVKFGGDEEEITKEMLGSMNQVLIRIYISANSMEEMIEAVDFANATIKVIDEFGNDMILFRFDANIVNRATTGKASSQWQGISKMEGRELQFQ